MKQSTRGSRLEPSQKEFSEFLFEWEQSWNSSVRFGSWSGVREGQHCQSQCGWWCRNEERASPLFDKPTSRRSPRIPLLSSDESRLPLSQQGIMSSTFPICGLGLSSLCGCCGNTRMLLFLLHMNSVVVSSSHSNSLMWNSLACWRHIHFVKKKRKRWSAIINLCAKMDAESVDVPNCSSANSDDGVIGRNHRVKSVLYHHQRWYWVIDMEDPCVHQIGEHDIAEFALVTKGRLSSMIPSLNHTVDSDAWHRHWSNQQRSSFDRNTAQPCVSEIQGSQWVEQPQFVDVVFHQETVESEIGVLWWVAVVILFYLSTGSYPPKSPQYLHLGGSPHAGTLFNGVTPDKAIHKWSVVGMDKWPQAWCSMLVKREINTRSMQCGSVDPSTKEVGAEYPETIKLPSFREYSLHFFRCTALLRQPQQWLFHQSRHSTLGKRVLACTRQSLIPPKLDHLQNSERKPQFR